MTEKAFTYDPRLAMDDLLEVAAIHDRETAAGKRVDPADRAALAQAIARLKGDDRGATRRRRR